MATAKYWNAYDDVKKNKTTISNQIEAPYLKPKLTVSILPGRWPDIDQYPLSGQEHEPVNDDAAAGHVEVQRQERCHWWPQPKRLLHDGSRVGHAAQKSPSPKHETR